MNTIARARYTAPPALFALTLALLAFAATLALPSRPALAVAPANDSLASAISVALPSTTLVADNVDATIEGGEPLPACQANFTRSVWFKHTAATSAPLAADTIGSGNSDTVLAVYSGPAVSPTFGTLSAVACDDDSGPGNLSLAGFEAASGTTYYIQVGSFSSGTGSLNLDLALGPPGPPNAYLANAIAITTPAVSGIVALGDTTGALLEAGETTPLTGCVGGGVASPAISKSVWYNWTSPAGTGTVVFDTYGSSFDTVLAIYTGSGFPLTKVVCNDDFGTLRSGVTLTYAASTVYHIQVSSFGANGLPGSLVLNISLGADMVVTTTGEGNVPDSALSLREAMLLARDGTGAGGLTRALNVGEVPFVLNAAAAGASASDLIHFSYSPFFSTAPATIPLVGPLPDLNVNSDVVSGIGAGVIVDGQNVYSCFTVSGNSNHIEGVQVRRCAFVGLNRAVSVTGSNNVIGGALIPGQRNVIRENDLGVVFDTPGTGNKLIGSYIGTDAAGISALANGLGVLVNGSGNTIGGSAPGEGNLISGNSTGLNIVAASSNTILGNKIGTDVSGTGALGNATGIIIDGVTLGPAISNSIGGSGAGAGNVISGNSGRGVWVLGSSGTTIRGNRIGVGASGGALGNGSQGVYMEIGANNDLIGGLGAGEGNTIAFNGSDGVGLTLSDTRITVRGNSIYSNVGAGIAILAGGNEGILAPAINSATATTVTGTACPLCTIDVYSDQQDEGRVYTGSGTANGAGLFTVTVGAHTLTNATATQTDANGNTSEFTVYFGWPANSDGDGVPDASDACPLVAEDVDGYQDGDGCPDPDNDVDGVCDAGQTSVSCTGSDSGKLCFDPAGTLTCNTQDCRNIAEDYDNFKDTDGCPEPDNDNDGFQDFADNCPGSAAAAGADGMLGSPQDLNHNGRRDFNPPDPTTEAVFTTDDVVLTFEDYDGVLDGDGCHDSPGEDFDGDGFTDDAEALKIGTNPGYPCGNPGWPADLLADNRLNIGDINSFLFPLRGNGSFNKIFHPVPDPDDPNVARWDLQPSNTIDIGDLNALNPAVIAATARPPMFGGQPAFFANAGNGVGGCPLPP